MFTMFNMPLKSVGTAKHLAVLTAAAAADDEDAMMSWLVLLRAASSAAWGCAASKEKDHDGPTAPKTPRACNGERCMLQVTKLLSSGKISGCKWTSLRRAHAFSCTRAYQYGK